MVLFYWAASTEAKNSEGVRSCVIRADACFEHAVKCCLLREVTTSDELRFNNFDNVS